MKKEPLLSLLSLSARARPPPLGVVIVTPLSDTALSAIAGAAGSAWPRVAAAAACVQLEERASGGGRGEIIGAGEVDEGRRATCNSYTHFDKEVVRQNHNTTARKH